MRCETSLQKKLHKAEDLLKLPLEYLGIFALAAPEPVKDRKNQVRQMIAKNVKTRRDYLKQHSSAQACSHSILPEYALPCVIHMLAHHPDFKQNDHETLVQFRDYLWFFMEPILAKADNYSFLKKLVENVKQTRDAQAPEDEKVNKNLYTVCDLAQGLILNKVHSFVLKEFPGNPVLPKKFFVPSEKGSSPNTKSYLPKGFQFTSAKGPKKGGTVESKPAPSKASSKTSAKSDKKSQVKSKGRSSKTSRNAFKVKIKETQADDEEEEASETQESGFASPADEQPTARKRGRPASSTEQTTSKKLREESPAKSSRKSSPSPSKQKLVKESKQLQKKKASSPPKSPQRRSPFVAAEKLLSSKPSTSPRKARALKRQASELDALPEDEPDSGTSSLESPKKPLSSRQITQSSPKTKSSKQVNGLKDALNSKSSPVKKTKVKESSPVEKKEPVLVVKRKRTKPR